MLLGGKGIATSNKKLLGAPGIARNKDATRSKGHRLITSTFHRNHLGHSVLSLTP